MENGSRKCDSGVAFVDIRNDISSTNLTFLG
jgi:hypothetical protein